MKSIILKLKTILSAQDFIVTGSFVLSEYGLINLALVNDLDIILIKPDSSTIDTINRFMKEFPAKTRPIDIPTVAEPDAEHPVKKKVATNPDLHAIFMFDQIKVDVFISDQNLDDILVVDGIKYTTIPHIINAKKRMGRMKDWLQCRDMARYIFKQEEFESKINEQWRSMLHLDY